MDKIAVSLVFGCSALSIAMIISAFVLACNRTEIEYLRRKHNLILKEGNKY